MQSSMKLKSIESLSTQQKEEIFSIWQQVYPEPVTFVDHEAFEVWLRETCKKSRHWVLSDESGLCGWLCTFDRDHKRWFTILVASDKQRSGLGRKLIQTLMENEPEVYGWMIPDDSYKKVTGDVYQSPWSFYQKMGFQQTGVRWKTEEMVTHQIYWAAEN